MKKRSPAQQGNESPELVSDSGEPVFDHTAMSKRLMGDAELIGTVAGAFLGDMTLQIELLKTAVANNDLQAAAAQSHKIKGAAANVGGMALSAMALKIESSVEAGESETLGLQLPELELCFTQLKLAMEEML